MLLAEQILIRLEIIVVALAAISILNFVSIILSIRGMKK